MHFTLPEVMVQLFPELHPRAQQPRFYCVHLNAHNLRRLFRGGEHLADGAQLEPLEMLQLKDRALARRQLIKRFLDGLARLSEAGIATFVVHGNHDPVEAGWSAIGTWPAGVTVFGTESVDAVPVMVGGTQIAVVQGISYWRRDVLNRQGRSARQSSPMSDIHPRQSACGSKGLYFCPAGTVTGREGR